MSEEYFSFFEAMLLEVNDLSFIFIGTIFIKLNLEQKILIRMIFENIYDKINENFIYFHKIGWSKQISKGCIPKGIMSSFA